MLRDPRIKAIINTRGGYGSLRLLDRIDYDEIKRNPKIILGFSDITALLLAVHARTGVVTFHGPVLRQFGRGAPENWNELLRVLGSDRPLRWSLAEGKSLSAGKARGPLLGGNLSLICHLLGTPYMPSLEGAILFIEEANEPLYRIDRMLTHLKLSGKPAGLSGMVVGQMEGCGKQEAIEQLLRDLAGELNIALATGLNVGHGGRNLTVPLGVAAELDTEKMILATGENAVA
jgi:muramoyltetrapeptide carboxypeptidase